MLTNKCAIGPPVSVFTNKCAIGPPVSVLTNKRAISPLHRTSECPVVACLEGGHCGMARHAIPDEVLPSRQQLKTHVGHVTAWEKNNQEYLTHVRRNY